MEPYTPRKPLPAQPTRAELRDACRAAKLDADAGVPGAQAFLEAVHTLTRILYPKKARSTENGGRSRRKRALITPADCEYTCPYCHGKGGSDALIRVPADRKRDTFSEHRHFWTCPVCNGTGKLHGTPEHAEPYKWRGNPAPTGPYRTTKHGGKVTCHKRGFVNGQWIGPKPGADRMPLWMRRWCWQPGNGCAGASPIDVNAALEGFCSKLLRRGRLLPQPHSMKKLGSRRDKNNLTARQERRSKMERRVRRYQSEVNKRQKPIYTKRDHKAALDGLAALGIDVVAIEKQLQVAAPKVEHDEPIVAEARRRADLPPDDERVPKTDGPCCPRCGKRGCGGCAPIANHQPDVEIDPEKVAEMRRKLTEPAKTCKADPEAARLQRLR
jgi:hypothetical protein